MLTINVGDHIGHAFQVLTPEWYLLKDGSPLPSNLWEPRLVGDGSLVMKSLETILAVYGILPKKIGWEWRDDRKPGYDGPGAGLFTIGWLKGDSWEAALGFNSRRMILPWSLSKGLPALTEIQKITMRRDTRVGNTILVHGFMDSLYLSEEAAEKYLNEQRNLLREEDRRCSRKAQ